MSSMAILQAGNHQNSPGQGAGTPLDPPAFQLRVHPVTLGQQEDALWQPLHTQLCALKLWVSPKGTEPLSWPGGAGRSSSQLCQKGSSSSQLCQGQQLPGFGEESSSAGAPVGCSCPQHLANPSQVEDGALRQWENPGLVSLHKQYVQGINSSCQPPAVSPEFGTNQHGWKVGNALIRRKNFQTFQLGAQVGTARGCGDCTKPLTSISPSSLNLKQPKLLFQKQKLKQKSPG